MLKRHPGLTARQCLFAAAVALLAQTFPSAAAVKPGSDTYVGRTAAESGPPRWPVIQHAPRGAPNVLIIMTDDVGFGASSTFGGPIPTPTFDRLAKEGLRYTQFNTAAMCSATRAALLTGRDSHNVSIPGANNLANGYDGYTSVLPKSAGTLAEVLRQNGYSTAMFGKWHLVPEWEKSEAGPFDRWPTGEGFEYFYGFLEGDTDQWAPDLVENTRHVTPPAEETHYLLEQDLSDRAVAWMRRQHDVAPDKPFFLYYASPSAHAPHHAPKEWLERFRGKFSQGWDAVRSGTYVRQKELGIIPVNARLTLRPSFLPAWQSLTNNQRKVYERLMEAYAADLAYADVQFGKMIDSLRATGQLENTLVIYIQGDNGSSGEGGLYGTLFEESMINLQAEDFDYVLAHVEDIGGPRAYNNYPAAWGWAMNTPFQYYKQIASHFGGIRNGIVISWPDKIKNAGSIRTQFHHVADIYPTVLESAGIATPATLNGVQQLPIDGVSMVYTFDEPRAESHRHLKVFENVQNLGIYSEGWWAGTRPAKAPWELFSAGSAPLDSRTWELYHVLDDYSQGVDLAKTDPARLTQMQQLFWAEAGRNHILPIHDPTQGTEGRPSLTANRTRFVFHAGTTRVPESAAPRLIDRSYTIDADVTIQQVGPNGVLVTQGGRFGGYAFYVKDGYPVFHYNDIGPRQYQVRSAQRLALGPHRVSAEFKSDGTGHGSGGVMALMIDGKTVAQGRIEHTLGIRVSHSEGFDVGEDCITPINDDYSIATSRFSGELQQLVITVQ